MTNEALTNDQSGNWLRRAWLKATAALVAAVGLLRLKGSVSPAEPTNHRVTESPNR